MTRSQLQVIGAMAALPYPPNRTIVGAADGMFRGVARGKA